MLQSMPVKKSEKRKQTAMTLQQIETVVSHTVFVQQVEIVFIMDQLQRM